MFALLVLLTQREPGKTPLASRRRAACSTFLRCRAKVGKPRERGGDVRRDIQEHRPSPADNLRRHCRMGY